MRLTLRTLLAYLDDILEPDDAREIGKKIEESEFAANLMHRTRDVVRRLRLAAPSVSDRTHGFDANTVAEYLDNTLPGDRVSDFEKVCLESDSQLAEVASCHQILTMVLGEPAEVDPALRQRMYDMPELLAAEPVDSGKAAIAEPAAPAAGGAAVIAPSEDEAKLVKAKPTVPDYLRESRPQRSRFLPMAVMVMVVAVLVVLVFGALGVFEGLRLQAPESGVQTATTPGPTTKADTQRAKLEEAPGRTIAVSPAAPAETKPSPTAVAGPAPAPVKPELAPTAKPVEKPADKPVERAVEKPAPAVVAKLESRPSLPAAVEAKPAVADSMPLGKVPANPLPTTAPAAVPGMASATLGGAPGASGTPAVAPAGATPTPGAALEAPPMPPERLGRFVLDKQVMLQYDRASSQWLRMGPQAVLSSSVPLLSLPSYQPILALTVGATVQLIGGTELELLPTDSQGTPGLKIKYGRMVVRAVGEAKARLRVQVAEHVGTVTFKNAESTLGISIDRLPAPGTDPEQQAGVLVANLYAVSGEFVWEEGGGKPPVAISAPSMLRVDNEPLRAPVVMPELPRWLNGEDLSGMDRWASPVLEQSIPANRPVSLSLRELANHRRVEVASLAVRSLGFVGEFEPMVGALNAPEHKVHWDDYLRSLEQGVARGQETAEQIRDAFEKQYQSQGPALYRMLWGYTPQDLKGEQGAKLVGYLDHEMLVYRVMAYHNLERLPGQKFGYRPQDPVSKRQPAVLRWKERLQGGLLGPAAR